ncbi:MAG: hypothetical protein IT218_02580 [Ignavibacteria bacterium]|nr:hypothetical protein [Ignavibacteria bacterium]
MQANYREVTELLKHETPIKHNQTRVLSIEFQANELLPHILGSMREPFISDVHPSQLALGLGVDPEQVAAAVEAAKVENPPKLTSVFRFKLTS